MNFDRGKIIEINGKAVEYSTSDHFNKDINRYKFLKNAINKIYYKNIIKISPFIDGLTFDYSEIKL